MNLDFKKGIYNLLMNAINYTPEGGEIVLKIYTEENSVKCSIKDKGIGISTYDMIKIFERYYRSDNAVKMNPSGNGIGLSIVKNIIDLHNGKIDIHSIVGQGSTFIIGLPVN